MKNESTIVINIIDMLFQTEMLINGNISYNLGAIFSANASDANALDKNPANVIPI